MGTQAVFVEFAGDIRSRILSACALDILSEVVQERGCAQEVLNPAGGLGNGHIVVDIGNRIRMLVP